MKYGLAAVFALAGLSSTVLGQAVSTASRTGDLQVGVTFNLAIPDFTNPIDPTYVAHKFKGLGFYSTFDIRHHLGVEAEFHQVNDPDSKQGTYERTFEIGPRYVRHFGRFSPYGKVMVGRGVFNFPATASNPAGGSVANLAYTMFAGGVGADFTVHPSINVRADFELQRWLSFPANDLAPSVFSLGVAYHFK